MEFTIHDTFGEYEIASFQGSGKDYSEGMMGVIQIFHKIDSRSPWNKMPEDKKEHPTATPKSK